MFDLDVAALAQAGAVGIALGMVLVGGFVSYKVALRLVGAAERILTNHLHDLVEELRGMRQTLARIEVALVGKEIRPAGPASATRRGSARPRGK